jgi:hypothetical protein
MNSKFIQNFRKPEGKKQLRKLLCRWEDDIKIDLNYYECGLGPSFLVQGPAAGCNKQCNEYVCSTKGRNFSTIEETIAVIYKD